MIKNIATFNHRTSISSAGFPKFTVQFMDTPKLKNYLKSVVSGFEYVARTGEDTKESFWQTFMVFIIVKFDNCW